MATLGIALEVEGLGKTFPSGQVALSEFSLRVEPGEWLVIVGPSGGGKTTALRLIAGLDEPSAGSVRLGGVEATRLPPWQRRVAMAFQRPALAPSRNVRSNLLLGQKRPNLPLIERLASLLRIADLLERYPHELSGGQQQRVALGRALARAAPVCLLDEPLGHLDAPLREQLRRDLLLLHNELGATIISVTHDPAEAWACGRRVAVLHQGRLQQAGAPETLYRRPSNRFVAEFLARGPVNFFEGAARRQGNSIQWIGKDWHCCLPWMDIPEPKDAVLKGAVLGLRAEDVQVALNPRDDVGDGRPMQAAAVEPQPGGAWVSGEVEGRPLAGWAAAGTDVRPGMMVYATMNWNQAFLFERDTGRSLASAIG
jgi:multiple sugar transport system ATP-binding protein